MVQLLHLLRYIVNYFEFFWAIYVLDTLILHFMNINKPIIYQLDVFVIDFEKHID